MVREKCLWLLLPRAGLRGSCTGRPVTLGAFLTSHVPLMFPASAPLAHVIVQGVLCPRQAEIAWLGACLAGADGWVNLCVGLGARE